MCRALPQAYCEDSSAESILETVMESVGQTPVFLAFEAVGRIESIVVWRYPRIVGLFNPNAAEWIVLVNGTRD